MLEPLIQDPYLKLALWVLTSLRERPILCSGEQHAVRAVSCGSTPAAGQAGSRAGNCSFSCSCALICAAYKYTCIINILIKSPPKLYYCNGWQIDGQDTAPGKNTRCHRWLSTFQGHQNNALSDNGILVHRDSRSVAPSQLSGIYSRSCSIETLGMIGIKWQ